MRYKQVIDLCSRLRSVRFGQTKRINLGNSLPFFQSTGSVIKDKYVTSGVAEVDKLLLLYVRIRQHLFKKDAISCWQEILA